MGRLWEIVMRKFLALVAAPAAVSVAIAVPAVARPSSATLEVSTAGGAQASGEMTTGSSLVFGGCGYQPGVGVSVTVTSPTAIAFFGGIADSAGCFSTGGNSWYTADDAGTYKAQAYQSSKRKADATITFVVAD
ncbi:MAG: hypothetical protein ACTHKG_15520 [Nocardioides sp.]